jgi:hypothetical protein
MKESIIPDDLFVRRDWDFGDAASGVSDKVPFPSDNQTVTTKLDNQTAVPVHVCPLLGAGVPTPSFNRSATHSSPEKPDQASDSKPNPNYYEESTQPS